MLISRSRFSEKTTEQNQNHRKETDWRASFQIGVEPVQFDTVI